MERAQDQRETPAAYLEEMTFRFNRRKNPDLWSDTLRHMITADPLTFEDLTSEKDDFAA
ncbi:MAG TPA: hypothetical protein VJW20_04760 [Candidatus Angelobacter sp.]|nr:hypothetical protein [Candidatus Angelobacter sp.]